MSNVVEFREWPKTMRLFRDVVITEKIDGTHACVIVTEDGTVAAQSRKRLITPKRDNYGFAAWVHENSHALREILGPGYHYGEWWGAGIQRRYGLVDGDKRFSLFNTDRWGWGWLEGDALSVPGLNVVPVLYQGTFNESAVTHALADLEDNGSHAAIGFPNPEGVIVYHTAIRQCFKVTLDNDGHKGQVAA